MKAPKLIMSAHFKEEKTGMPTFSCSLWMMLDSHALWKKRKTRLSDLLT